MTFSQAYDEGSCWGWKASTRAMAISSARARSRSIVGSRGVIETPSKRAICSAANASPRARTPAIIASATRNASLLAALRRSSSARSAASASGDGALSQFILRFLNSRDQFASDWIGCSVEVLRYDQPRCDLRDQVLQHELVDAHRLAGLHAIDDVRGEAEHGRQLHRTAQRHDLGVHGPLVEVAARDARVLRGDARIFFGAARGELRCVRRAD